MGESGSSHGCHPRLSMSKQSEVWEGVEAGILGECVCIGSNIHTHSFSCSHCFENKDKILCMAYWLLPTCLVLESCWLSFGFLSIPRSFLPQRIFVECPYPHSRVNSYSSMRSQLSMISEEDFQLPSPCPLVCTPSPRTMS